MANYYTNVSFVVECTDAEAAMLRQLTMTDWSEVETLDGPLADKFASKEQLMKLVTNDANDEPFLHEIEDDPKGVWIYGGEGMIDHLVGALQAIVDIPADKPIAFQWGDDCSKPRLDAYGGGCAVVTNDDIEMEHTSARLTALVDDVLSRPAKAG